MNKKITNEKTITKNDIINKLNELKYTYGVSEIFYDCLELLVMGLIYDFTPTQAKNINALQIIKDIRKKYSEQDNKFIDDLLNDIGAYVVQFGDKPDDYLGALYMDIVSNRTRQTHQQFFTPFHISELMGLITIGDLDTASNEVITINDPCCGSGSLCLGKITALQRNGINPLKRVLVYANDIDLKCVYMTYIQFCIAGIPAVIQHKDTLLNKVYKTFYTPWYYYLKTYRELTCCDNQKEKPEN